MVREYTEDDLNMIGYFYEEKDDVTRYVCWDDIKDAIFRDFPHFQKAIQDVEIANKMLDSVVHSLEMP